MASHGMHAVLGTRSAVTLGRYLAPTCAVHGTCKGLTLGDWHPSVCGALHPCILA